MTSTIKKWGNSQGIRISKALLDAVHWNDNEKVVISAENDRIIIEKASARKNIKELFEDFDGDYKPLEIDWGKSVGDEIW